MSFVIAAPEMLTAGSSDVAGIGPLDQEYEFNSRKPRRAKRATSAMIAAVVPMVIVSAGTLAMPMAHADPLDGIRNAVTDVRGKSGCPPLLYKVELEAAAQQAAAPNSPLAKAIGYGGQGPDHVDGYPGKPAWYFGVGDPASEAISGQFGVMSNGASGAISDCRFTDYGVGFARGTFNTDTTMDQIVIVLGQPAAPVAPPPPPANPPHPGILPNHDPISSNPLSNPPSHFGTPEPAVSPPPPPVNPPPSPSPTPTATVTSDVDLYDVPGGNGNIIGMLRKGQVIKVAKPCPSDDWCDLTDPKGSAWGSFLQNN